MTDIEKKKVRESEQLLAVMKMVKECGNVRIFEDYADVYNELIVRRGLGLEQIIIEY